MKLSILAGLGAAAVTIAAIPASAEIRLVDAAPAASATASKVEAITLHFSEAIVPASIAVDLTMTAMPGMTHHDPMKVTGFTTVVSSDATGATLTLPRALPAGTYQVHWRASAASGGAAESSYAFTAR